MDLRPLLHYSEAALHTPNRLATSCWIENASTSCDGTATLRICCAWSPEPLEICIDIESGIAYLGPGTDHSTQGMKAMDAFLEKYNEEALGSPPTPSPQASAGPSSAATMGAGITKIGRLLRRLRDSNRTLQIWPVVSLPPVFKDAATRSSLLADISRYIEGSSSVVSGALLTCSLLSNAAFSAKAHFAASPLPPFIEANVPSYAGAQINKAEPRSQQEQQKLLQEGLTDIYPSLMKLTALAATSTASPREQLQSLLVDEGKRMSLMGLYLLHWLLLLAPVRLVKKDKPLEAAVLAKMAFKGRLGQEKCSYFHLIHGAANPHSLPSLADLPKSLPWDIGSWEKSGEYRESGVSSGPLYWFHGTSSELAYTILQLSLRNMSGSRREANGSMLGSGIYLSNDPSVCQEFASATGVHLPLSGVASSGTAAKLDPVKCRLRVLLECRVIANPDSNELYRQGTEIGKGIHSRAAATSTAPGVPASSYLIVKDGGSLAITGLYLYEPMPESSSAAAHLNTTAAVAGTPRVAPTPTTTAPTNNNKAAANITSPGQPQASSLSLSQPKTAGGGTSWLLRLAVIIAVLAVIAAAYIRWSTKSAAAKRN
jgi:hypothetical protein